MAVALHIYLQAKPGSWAAILKNPQNDLLVRPARIDMLDVTLAKPGA